jgi:hypothetical protein
MPAGSKDIPNGFLLFPDRAAAGRNPTDAGVFRPAPNHRTEFLLWSQPKLSPHPIQTVSYVSGVTIAVVFPISVGKMTIHWTIGL